MRVQVFATVCPLSLSTPCALELWKYCQTDLVFLLPVSSPFLWPILALIYFFFLGFAMFLCFSSISCNQVKGVFVDRGDLYSAFVWYLLFPNGAACCKKSQMLPICCRAPLNYGGWMFTTALAVAFSPYSSKWYVFTSNYWDRESGLVSEVCHLVAYP